MTELVPLTPEEQARIDALLREAVRFGPGEGGGVGARSVILHGGYAWDRQLSAVEVALLHRYLMLRRMRLPEEP